LALVLANFQNGLSAQLARGGDVIVDADSIFSGRGDDWNNAVSNQLRDAIVGTFQNSGNESGWGSPSGRPMERVDQFADLFPQERLNGNSDPTKTTSQGVAARWSWRTTRCRFSFPAIMSHGAARRSHPDREVELIISFRWENQRRQVAVDVYPTSAPLAAVARLS
jgi:hypothetical protein